jgi:hypothetical protein
MPKVHAAPSQKWTFQLSKFMQTAGAFVLLYSPRRDSGRTIIQNIAVRETVSGIVQVTVGG